MGKPARAHLDRSRRRATSSQTIYIRKVEKVGGKLGQRRDRQDRERQGPDARRDDEEVSARRLDRRPYCGRRAMISQIMGVLFDGLAYGMLLFLLSVGLSVTLGLMNFINLAHGSFAMLGGYVTLTLMRDAGWPFLADPASRLPGRGGRQRRLRAHAVPAALPGERAQPGAVHDRPGLRRGGRGAPMSSARCNSRSRCRTICAARSRRRHQLRLYRMFLIAVALVVDGAAGLRAGAHPLRRQVRAAVDNQRVAQGPRHRR